MVNSPKIDPKDKLDAVYAACMSSFEDVKFYANSALSTEEFTTSMIVAHKFLTTAQTAAKAEGELDIKLSLKKLGAIEVGGSEPKEPKGHLSAAELIRLASKDDDGESLVEEVSETVVVEYESKE